MDPIKQSRGSLQIPTNQQGSSDPSKLSQGVKEPIQTISLPKHYTSLQTPVISIDTQRLPGQMSPSLLDAGQQTAPWLLGTRFRVSNDTLRSRQNPLQEVRISLKCTIYLFITYIFICNLFFKMLHLSEQFKDMTTGNTIFIYGIINIAINV